MKNITHSNTIFLEHQFNTEDEKIIQEFWSDFPYKFDYVLYQINLQYNNKISDIIIDLTQSEPLWTIDIQGVYYQLVLNGLVVSKYEIQTATKNILNLSYQTPLLNINGAIRTHIDNNHIVLRFLSQHNFNSQLDSQKFITLNNINLELIKLHKDLQNTLHNQKLDSIKLKL